MRSAEHPCPNHNSVRVPRAYGRPSIPAHRSVFECVRSAEHPCPTDNYVQVLNACDQQSIHAQLVAGRARDLADRQSVQKNGAETCIKLTYTPNSGAFFDMALFKTSSANTAPTLLPQFSPELQIHWHAQHFCLLKVR